MKPKLLLILFGISLALIVAEITARTIFPKFHFPSECFDNHPVLSFTHVPNKTCKFQTYFWNTTYKINSQGLRDKEYPLKKDGAFRILVLGDSLTEGFGVEQHETYSKQLEKLLTEKLKPRKIEVINAGVAGYSPVLEYLYLKEKGLNLSPDLIILDFSLTDFLDEKEFAKVTILEENKPIAVKPFTPPHTQSYLEYLENPLAKKRTGGWLGGVEESLTKYSYLAKIFFSPKPKQLDLSSLFTPDKESWDLVRKNLLLISDLLSQNQIDFLLIAYPYFNQLENQEFLEPIVTLAQFAKEQEVEFLDLTQSFRQQQVKSLYLPDLVHLSPQGHQLISQILASYLIQKIP